MTILPRIFLVVGLLGGIPCYATQTGQVPNRTYSAKDFEKVYKAMQERAKEKKTNVLKDRTIEIIEQWDLLGRAVVRGHCDVVEVLLQVEKVKQAINGYYNPLRWAARMSNPNGKKIEMVKLLLNHGASPTRIDENGETPLHDFVEFGTPEQLELLLEKAEKESTGTFSIDIATQQGETLLHKAVRYGNDAMVRFLISKGADINRKTASGDTLLHVLARSVDRGVVEEEEIKDLSDFLIEKGADPLIQNNDGKIPSDLIEDSDCPLKRYLKGKIEEFHQKKGIPVSANQQEQIPRAQTGEVTSVSEPQKAPIDNPTDNPQKQIPSSQSSHVTSTNELQESVPDNPGGTPLLSNDQVTATNNAADIGNDSTDTLEKGRDKGSTSAGENAEIVTHLPPSVSVSWWQSPKVLVPTVIMLMATGGIAYKWYRLKQQKVVAQEKDLIPQVATGIDGIESGDL